MVAFLYTDNETVPLKLHQKNKKQTENRNKLTKAVKDLRAESYKTLITEVET